MSVQFVKKLPAAFPEDSIRVENEFGKQVYVRAEGGANYDVILEDFIVMELPSLLVSARPIDVILRSSF